MTEFELDWDRARRTGTGEALYCGGKTSEQIADILTAAGNRPMLLTRLLLPSLLARGRGHICNIASLGGKTPTAYDVSYAAAKAGLVLFSKSLRDELRGTGVGVSLVCPGFISDIGMFADKTAAYGLRVPRTAGTLKPDQVASDVIDASVVR